MQQSSLIGDWSITNITNSTTMTVAFWINISETNPGWRNIFHVSNQNVGCCNIGNRVPGMWLCENTTQVYIRHDSSTKGDDGPGCSSYQIPLNTNVFITIVFDTNKMTFYANAIIQQTYTFSSALISASSDASFYMRDPWNSDIGFQIKNFSLYNSVFSSSDVTNLYNEDTSDTSDTSDTTDTTSTSTYTLIQNTYVPNVSYSGPINYVALNYTDYNLYINDCETSCNEFPDCAGFVAPDSFADAASSDVCTYKTSSQIDTGKVSNSISSLYIKPTTPYVAPPPPLPVLSSPNFSTEYFSLLEYFY
jgi:hypothetical protein